MLIGNKSFPYPLLKKGSNTYYKDTQFELKFSEDNAFVIRDGNLIFRGIHFELDNPELKLLYKAKKANVICEVECSKTVFRDFFELNEQPQDKSIPVSCFSGVVSISAYMVATEDVYDFYSNDFVDVYKGYKFHFNPGNIIAADDGIKFNVDIDEHKDDKMASIFTIIQQDDAGDIVSYLDDGKRIVIYLNPEGYRIYDTMKADSQYNNLFFATLVIPVLTNCLQEIINDYGEELVLDEICESKKWFKAIMVRYKDIYGEELDADELLNSNCFELSQILMGKPTSNCILDFRNMLTQSSNDEDDED